MITATVPREQREIAEILFHQYVSTSISSTRANSSTFRVSTLESGRSAAVAAISTSTAPICPPSSLRPCWISRARCDPRCPSDTTSISCIHALAETPVTVKDTESGDERELIAVSKGDESFPSDVVQLRGEFSSLFGKQAFQTRYDAPEVDATTTPAPFVRPETHETAD